VLAAAIGRGNRAKTGHHAGVFTDSAAAKPATTLGLIIDSAPRQSVDAATGPPSQPGRAPSASAYEPYRELIERGLRLVERRKRLRIVARHLDLEVSYLLNAVRASCERFRDLRRESFLKRF